jgi:hypothetical protein
MQDLPKSWLQNRATITTISQNVFFLRKLLIPAEEGKQELGRVQAWLSRKLASRQAC